MTMEKKFEIGYKIILKLMTRLTKWPKESNKSSSTPISKAIYAFQMYINFKK